MGRSWHRCRSPTSPSAGPRVDRADRQRRRPPASSAASAPRSSSAILLANRIGATLRLATRTDAPDGRASSRRSSRLRVRLDGALEPAHVPIDGDQRAADHRRRDRHDHVVVDDPRRARQHGPPRAGALPPPGGRADVLRRTATSGCCAARPWPSRTSPWSSTPSGCSTTCRSRTTTRTWPRTRSRSSPAFPGGPPRDGADPARAATASASCSSTPVRRTPATCSGAEARCLSRAVEQRVLDPDEWELPLRRPRAPRTSRCPRDVTPQVVEGLNWLDYQDLVPTMDAALVLMDTPHPSYPPLRPRRGRRARC